MENIEILFLNVNKHHLDNLVKKEFKVSSEKVRTSHFYDSNTQSDIEFTNEFSLEEYYSIPNTGNILTKEAFIGETVRDILILISCDALFSDIELNFQEEKILCNIEDDLKCKLKKIINYLSVLYKEYQIEEIRVGYEPACDDDMLLFTINAEGFKLANNFKDSLSNALRSL